MRDLWQAFRAKIQEMFRALDPVNNQPGRDVVVAFASAAGVPLAQSDLDFTMRSARSASAVAKISQLLNSVPAGTGNWSASGEMLWSIYHDVLTATDLAENVLSAEEEAKLNECRRLLLQKRTVATSDGLIDRIIETGQYAMYQQLSMVYDRIRLKYNNLRITAKYSEHERDQELWSLNRPIYEEQLKRQYRDLVSRGNKNEVEAAIQFIDQVTGRGVPLRWRQMKDDFEISKRSGPAGDTYYDITLVPENVLGASEDAWTEVAIRTDEGQAVRDSTGYADVPGGGFDSQVRGVERISVKLLSAAIGRPWFDRSIFRSRGWRWAPSSGISTPLSTGQWPATGRTLLPLYPTAALFAKGLKIEGSQLDLSGSTTTGPMSLQGARVAAGSIACDGIQIMGVVCDVVPRCPDPDPSLRWL